MLEKMKEIIAEQLNCEESEIHPETNFKEMCIRDRHGGCLTMYFHTEYMKVSICESQYI